MLTIIIEGEEVYDESTNEFSTVNNLVVDLEHSLISLSKWESKYEKAFLGDDEKTSEELFEYMKFMVITPNFDLDNLYSCNEKNLVEIKDYINSAQTATTFNDLPQPTVRKQIITSEIIYYWMIVHNIPIECESWHLNKLFALIKVCNAKQSKPKKMSKAELAKHNHDLNARRRAELGTSG